MKKKLNYSYIEELSRDISKNSMISYEELPQYDLFLSQVIDFLNDKFPEDNYTNNIVQNYIKSEVITKPEDGKKRGYTRMHLAELVLLSYMRPILTCEEIKKVFRLAFNEINDRNDDIISWEKAFKIFTQMQKETYDSLLTTNLQSNEKFEKIIKELELEENDEQKIRIFLLIISLVAQASAIKKLVEKVVNNQNE